MPKAFGRKATLVDRVPPRGGSERKERQCTRILYHAARLFSELGYASTTVDMLAEVTQMNKASIYYYFENKREILFTLIEESANDLLEVSKPALDLEPRLALRYLIQFGIGNFYRHIHENRIFSQELPYLTETLSRAQYDKIHRMQRDYMKIVYNVIERGIAQGLFRKGDVRLLGQLFAGWNLAPIRLTELVSEEEMVDAVSNLFISGLCADGTARPE